MNIFATPFPSPAGSGCWNINVKVVAELFSPFSLNMLFFHSACSIISFRWNEKQSLQMNTGKNSQNIKLNNISRSGERISTILSCFQPRCTWDLPAWKLPDRSSASQTDKTGLKMPARLHHQANILSRSWFWASWHFLSNEFSPAHGFFRTMD